MWTLLSKFEQEKWTGNIDSHSDVNLGIKFDISCTVNYYVQVLDDLGALNLIQSKIFAHLKNIQLYSLTYQIHRKRFNFTCKQVLESPRTQLLFELVEYL